MREQVLFFEQERDGRRLEVVKTYDVVSARESFAEMDGTALGFLADSLDLVDSYDEADIPERTSLEYAGFLWEEVQDCAREDGNVCSFFVVQEIHLGNSRVLYVSPDWPSAEAFVKTRASLNPV